MTVAGKTSGKYGVVFVSLSCLLTWAWNGVTTVQAGENASEASREARVWTDVTGEYQVQATYLDYDRGRVQLRKEDGSELSVALESLSSADRDLIRQIQRQKYLDHRRQRRLDANGSADDSQSTSRTETPPPRNADLGHDNSCEQLYGINWHDSREGAVAAAQQAGDKPIMWFRVLGDLKGFM